MFIHNKYTVWYDSIIQRAQNQYRVRRRKGHIEYVYYENHHIIPKSMGGSDNKVNLVLLTPKEHFICHLLLVKMCADSSHAQKMRFALKMIMGTKMTTSSSAIYAKMRTEIASDLSDLHRGKPKSKDQISKMVNTRVERGNYTHCDEVKIKIGESSTGRKQSEKTKLKRSKTMQGRSHGSRFWVNDGENIKRVSKDIMEELLNNGWVKGRLKLVHNERDIIHRFINGIKEVKYVDDKFIFLQEGWEEGRGPHAEDHCINISKSSKGKPKSASHKQNLKKSAKKAWSEGRHRPL